MTKPLRKKPAKASAKKVSPAVRQSPATANATAHAPRRRSTPPTATHDLAALAERVVAIIEEARARVVRTVTSEVVLSYWHIGRELVEFVQGVLLAPSTASRCSRPCLPVSRLWSGGATRSRTCATFGSSTSSTEPGGPEIHHEARDESARELGAAQKRHEARCAVGSASRTLVAHVTVAPRCSSVDRARWTGSRPARYSAGQTRRCLSPFSEANVMSPSCCSLPTTIPGAIPCLRANAVTLFSV